MFYNRQHLFFYLRWAINLVYWTLCACPDKNLRLTLCFIFMVCVYVVWIKACLCSCVVGTRVCLCAWVVEGDTSCLPPSVSTLWSESESLIDFRVHQFGQFCYLTCSYLLNPVLQTLRLSYGYYSSQVWSSYLPSMYFCPLMDLYSVELNPNIPHNTLLSIQAKI